MQVNFDAPVFFCIYVSFPNEKNSYFIKSAEKTNENNKYIS